MITNNIPRHIYWSCRGKTTVDENDLNQKHWLLEQTLTHGTMADIQSLNISVIEDALPRLRLPRHVLALWRDYFERRHSHAVSQKNS